MEVIPLILRFMEVFLKLVDEVTHLVHLHPLHAFLSKVYYELSDLFQTVLSDQLASDKLASKVHCAILDRGYLVDFLSLFYITIILPLLRHVIRIPQGGEPCDHRLQWLNF
jgi:hypothetical protein